jgi:serine/threonine protein kinase
MNKPSSKPRDNRKDREREKEKEKSKPKSKDDKNLKKKNHLYKIERVCGNGSFGIVFQGKILHTGETIAIKKVYQDRRFRNREFSIMSLLDHPNIVKVRHAFYTTGEKLDEIYLNLVMNYVPENLNRLNKSLFEKKEQLPVFLIKLYCFQIARALNYIHNKKICHRDIKPQNILLDPQTNRIYICDFGSAKLLKREESNVSYICSRFYRAPELLLGNEYYTTSIDIWSFGCVLAELFKGKPLLRTENKDEQINKIMECLGGPREEDLAVIIEKDTAHELAKSTKGIKGKNFADVLPNCPSDLIDLISKILIYNPKKRLTAVEVMAHYAFDDLRNKENFKNEKYVMPNIFNFTQEEINGRKFNAELWKKIIPTWSEGYKNLLDVIAIREKK